MILLMGCAGAGKGTQGEMLVADYGFEYLSTGMMLREYATPEQKARMLTGELLSDDEIIAMVDHAIDEMKRPDHSILDGFPRTVSQSQWLLDKAAKDGRFKIKTVINLEVPESVVVERLLKRGREDDTEAVLRRRFELHHAETVPVIHYLAEKGVKVLDIDASGTPAEVHDTIGKVLA